MAAERTISQRGQSEKPQQIREAYQQLAQATNRLGQLLDQTYPQEGISTESSSDSQLVTTDQFVEAWRLLPSEQQVEVFEAIRKRMLPYSSLPAWQEAKIPPRSRSRKYTLDDFPNQEFLTADEAALVLNRSQSQIRSFIQTGRLVDYPDEEGRHHIPRSAVESFKPPLLGRPPSR